MIFFGFKQKASSDHWKQYRKPEEEAPKKEKKEQQKPLFEGNELNTSEGLLYASKRVTNESNWSKFKLLDHGKSQDRNNRTFAATAFFKKHYEDWEDKTIEYNKLFNSPEKPLFNNTGLSPRDSSLRRS